MLYNKLVVVPIDKTSGNVAFACQGHYGEVFINELGLNNVNNINSAYANPTKPVETIVSQNALFMENKFNLAVTDMNKNLPRIY